MADNRNISLSDRLRAKGVQVGPLKTTPHQRVVGDTMAGQRNPETGLTQRLINKGVKINFVPSRSQSSQEQQASTQDTQAPFQSNLKETQLEVTKSNAELEIPRSNADRQKIRSAKDSDSLSKVLNEQDYMGEDQKAAQHLKVAQHAEKMAANAERSFENAQRGNFKSSKLLQGIYEQYGGKTTPSGQVVFENPAAAKLYDETAQQIANDEKQRAENFAAVQKNSAQEVENNEKRKEEASQHIILDVAPQKKQNYVSMSQADFDSAYGKVSVQQTISLQQAISKYTNLLVQKNAFEKEYGYTGNDFIWEDDDLEEKYDALEEAEEAAFEKMRNEYNAFLKTDAPNNDLYAQLILMYYTRAFDEHALDSYLDANNIKVLVSDTDSDLQNVKNSINNTVYKEHMQTVKNYQEFIAHYDERIAELSSDPLFMMSDIFLLQAANEQRQYEAYLKRNPDGVPPETDSKDDWTYFVASVVSSEDYADYAYVDKEILYPAIYQQKGKQQPTYEQQPAYAKNVQQGNLSENEKLFLAVNGASTRTNMVLGFTTYMSDDEIAVFNYLYQNPKYGPAVAKKFYEAITPDLKTRSTSNMEYLAAVRRADDVSDFGRIAEIAHAGLTGLANGLISFVQWIPGTEDWNKTNTMASQIVRQNQPYLLRQVSNAAESIGFMIPSLVASYYGGENLGSAITFATSGGRAAAEGREMGMSTAQSIGYGMLVGGAEAASERAIGGISLLRGTQSSFFGNLAKKAATTVGKMAVKFVGNVTSEIVEENLQNYWEPACRMIVGFTDQYDAPTVQDFIDTTISTIITTGIIEASNIKSTKAIMQYEQEVIAPWVEEALKYAKSGSNMQAIATKFKGMLDSGETITPKEFIDSCESITEEDKNDYTNAVIEEVQKRVEAVQMSNPEAQVVTSASTQSYLNQGIDLKTAQQAGEVLDGIVSGEITSENLSNNQIEKLNLMQPNMAAVASETLGLEIERPNSKSAARNTARQVIAQYAQQKASTASSGQDISMQQQTPVTTEAETEAAPQTTSEASTAMPETVTAPSIQTVSAPQTSPEASAATPEASVPIAQSPAVEQTTAVSSQKAQAEGKGNFITEYVAKNPNATDTEISAAYDAYRNGGTVTSSTARDTANPTLQTMEASTQTETSSAKTNANNAVDEQQKQSNATLDYLQFEEEYKSNNPKASMNDIAVAYQRYLNGEEIVDTKQSTGEAMSYKQFRKQYLKEHKKATPDEIEYAYNKYLNEPTDSKKYSVKEYGVVRDEYSEKVPEKAVEAVDALAKLFKLNIHFAELGENNGLYDPDTGEIWLDIHPHKAFEFVAGHEIAHALKARISEAAWNNFERYAVKAMGGKTAVAEKQTISEKYAKESDAREEVACDFVGKLLSDKQMLKDFCYAVEHRQIRPEAAKGLINVWKWFTGKFTNMTKKGDTETAELVAKVKEAFDTDIKTATEAIKALQTAYQEATKSDALRKTENTTNDGGVKHLIKSTPDGKKYVQADRQVIFGNDPESWSDQLEDYINGKIRRSENVTLIADDGDILTLTSRTAGKISDNHNSDGTLMDSEIFARKVSAGSHIDELATISMRGVRTVQDTYGKHAEDALKGWNYRTAYFRDNDGEYYKLTISVQQGSDGNAVYNIGKIQKRSFPTISGSSVKNGAQSDKEAYNGIIADKSESVNPSEAKNIKRDAKTTSDAEFFATEEGQKVYAENYGNLLETDAQIERAAARDEARAEEARQKIHAGETVREANKLLNEEMQKAAEQRLEERRRRAFTPDKKATERDYTEMSKEELAERLAYTEKSLKLEKLKKEHAQEQLKRTSGSKVDPTGIYSFVRKTLKEFDQGTVTQERVQEATKSLVSVFDKAAEIYDKLKDSEASAMLLWEHAQKMMEDIVQESKIYSVEESDSLYEQYSELRKELSSTTFLLPKQFASDISPEFAKWKNKYFGKFNVKLVEDGTGNIDSIYHDLAEAYPGLFRDSQSSEPDLLLQIANVAERIYTKPKADTPLWKVVSNEDIEAMTLNLYSNILMEFVRVEQNPRLQTRLDKVIARYEKKLADLRTSMQEKAARDISDAAKKERVNNEKETLRIVKYYENQLERIEKEYDKQVKKIKNAAKRNAKKSELKEAFAKDDAIKKYEKLDRSSKRKIEHLTAAKNAQIDRLKRVARQNAIANTVGGAEALRAIQKVWQDKGEDFKVLSLEDISTKTINASDISKKRSKSESIKKFYTEARRAFVTDIVEIEDFARNQSRVDNANVMATMYKNSGSMVETIQTGKLYSPDGEVIDDRSLASVAICWKDDKVGGKIDTQSQELYEKYLFHKHGYDRMSIEQKVRQEMEAFLSEHPEYNKSNTTHLRQKEILVKAKNGDNVAAEYIEIAKRFAEAKNKAVMGTEDGTKVNAQTHKMIFESIEKTSPWVAQKASELYAWWDKFMNAWVVGSELSSEQYARMKELYPHYVPTYRAFEKTDNGVYVTNKDGTTVRKSIKAAKGSTMDLMKVEDSLAVQVAKIVENRRFNDLALNIVHESIFATDFDVDNYQKAIYGYDSRKDNTSSGMKGNNIENYVLFAGDMDGNESTSSSTDDLYMQTEKSEKNRLIEDKGAIVLTAWENGVAVRAYVSKGLKKSLDALTGSYNPFSTAIKIGNKLTGIQKAAITGYNPFFAARNVPKDFALANVNSIAGLAFAKYETIAIAKMVSGDADWQRFKALGGTEANYYESESGFAKNIAKGKNVAAKAAKAAGAFNNATESMTRFAEYLATIERLGDTPEGRARAIKNAAEITVDFSRHGTVGKLLNAWIPYWNPQVQGMSRLFRSVFEAKDVKVALKTLGKATVASVLPEALLMALLHAVGAYDDWEELDDRTKDAYYAIPIGGGKFIKIAKGREWAQLIGNPLMRIWQGLNGREDPFEHYWETSIASNFMVPSELSLKGVLDATGVTDAVFLSQYIDLETNKDFAGRTIIPYEYQNASPSEQYDENTSWPAKKIGEATSWLAKKIGINIELSPMKIDYVIGDYFGDFGDMLIEATNESNNTFGNEFLDTALSSFVVDNAYSSRINTDYYDMIDEMTLQANDKKLRDPSYKDAIETKVKSAIENYYQVQISDLRNQISEEKNEDKKRLLTLEIRGLQEAAVEFYEKCMSGEIEEPVLYLEYAPYGDAVRNELIRLKEYNSEDYDYSFVPYPVAPNIGDHKNTDEEKANYTSIYESYYSDVVGDVISSNAYANADDEGKLNMLEGARELVHFYSKRDYAKAYDLSSDSYDPASAENKYDAIMQAGATFAEAHNIISGIASLDPIGDAESVTSVQMWKQILATENLTPEITDAAMRVYMTGSQEEKYDVMINSGLDPSAATSVMLKARQIDSEDKTINQKETSFSSWVDQRTWTSQQKNAAKDSYAFTSINVGESEKYDQLVNEYGFSSQKAEKAYLEISSLEPENGKDYVSDSQRNSKIVSMDFLTNAEQYSLLLSYYDTEYNKDTYKKIMAAQSKGISAKNYVKTWQEIAAIKGTDKNNDGITDTNSLKNNIAKYLRNASHLTYSQKCWFWRLRYSSGSEDGWKYNW